MIMKELSIEEKAKRYDEALERARTWKDKSGMPKNKQGILDDIFPELAESEDERVRKEVIHYFTKGTEFLSFCSVSRKQILTWLEKQGEQNPYSGVSFKYNGHTWGMCARDNGVEILVDGEIKERVFLDNKPQSKTARETAKEEKIDNSNKAEPKDYNSIDPYFAKPIDKVEPKFKVGDIIINKENGAISKINNILPYDYELISFETRNHLILDQNVINGNSRLWTIQDAKNGDILRIKNLTFIFQEITNNNVCHKDAVVACCSYEDNDDAFGTSGPDCITDLEIITPATKEQRDLLFQKMKEAGYEWDAETKELKKIEQKPTNNHFTPEQASILDKHIDEFIKQNSADNVEPKFKVGDWVTDGDKTTQIVAVGTGLYIINRKDMSEVSLSTEYIDKWYHLWTIQDAKDGDILVTMDDERPFIYKGCLDSNHPDSPVAYCGINSEGYFQVGGDKFATWWTDGKVQPATKEQCDTLLKAMDDAGYEFDFEKKELKKIEQNTAWSEEDERMYRGLHNLIYSTSYCDSRKELSDWLEYLKDKVQSQPKQGCSEEDEKCIKLSTDIIDSALRAGFCVQLDRDRCVDFLKSLKGRVQPKTRVE